MRHWAIPGGHGLGVGRLVEEFGGDVDPVAGLRPGGHGAGRVLPFLVRAEGVGEPVPHVEGRQDVPLEALGIQQLQQALGGSRAGVGVDGLVGVVPVDLKVGAEFVSVVQKGCPLSGWVCGVRSPASDWDARAEGGWPCRVGGEQGTDNDTDTQTLQALRGKVDAGDLLTVAVRGW